MTEAQTTDLDLLRHLDGVFVGLLDEEERAALDRCVAKGLAIRSYQGGGGFLGLAKVRLLSALRVTEQP